MKNLIYLDEWRIIQKNIDKENNRIYESLMSFGNGYMGMRGNFEENYSGDSLRGSYIAGVYYPDKTRVGWWKNGYPEYFAKVLNSTNIIGIKIFIDHVELDLDKCTLKDFHRELNMKEGYLKRSFIASFDDKDVKCEIMRFISMDVKEMMCIKYNITPLNFNVSLGFEAYLDGNVKNEDSNYDELFWNEINRGFNECGSGFLTMQTKKLDFHITSTMDIKLFKDNIEENILIEDVNTSMYIAKKSRIDLKSNETFSIEKYVSVVSNRYFKSEDLVLKGNEILNASINCGFNNLYENHKKRWDKIWEDSDIKVEGDIKAQQGIRYNIFQLNCTYTGEDERLNIGPKGFSGEKYGGATYWDTEAYCINFYLSTACEKVAKQLLLYRYNQLNYAKENAKKLGLKGALYPMVTMNGEECHNEWEITFEEIHRNGAIAYAIYNYVRYTGDEDYLINYGLDVLVEIARFWASRVSFSKRKGKYVILGVTGPNEYENNVNNNWYTNKLASWCLKYTLDLLKQHEYIKSKLNISSEELQAWEQISKNIYFPIIEEIGIFEQQDGFMDKEIIPASKIPKEDLPINQNWSWDRILRSCFIKQADVLQGMYFFSHEYSVLEKKKHFDFYEPLTVHESSLSPCVHCILAAEISYKEKAYEMYLRTSRLDLDDYNNDTKDGLHITSMAGTWMSFVHGFGGLRVKEGTLSFSPILPSNWKSYSFRIMFRNRLINLSIDKNNIEIKLISGNNLKIKIFQNEYILEDKINHYSA